MTRIRMGLVPGLLVVLALALAACGGSGKSDGVASLGDGKATATTGPGSSGNQQAALAFARCMRQHGIDMPDPNPDIDWGQEGRAPGWDAAWQACRHLVPPDPAAQDSRPSAQELGQLRAFAVCVRAHGIDMSAPDPTTGNMTMRGRLANMTKAQLQDDPSYRAAETACRDKLPAREKQQQK